MKGGERREERGESTEDERRGKDGRKEKRG